MARFYAFLDQWAQTLSLIRSEIDNRTFNTWYAPLKFRGVNRKSLVLGIPNENWEKYFKDGRSSRIILDAANRCFTTKLFIVTFRNVGS